jgi:hypothetical protein
MSWVELEPMRPVFKQKKAFHALKHMANMTGIFIH